MCRYETDFFTHNITNFYQIVIINENYSHLLSLVFLEQISAFFLPKNSVDPINVSRSMKVMLTKIHIYTEH